MRIRSFIIAYALVLAILLFADRRHEPLSPNRYSHVVDLTGQPADTERNVPLHSAPTKPSKISEESRTLIVAPDTLIPGTWTAGQIPAERLIAPLVVMDLAVSQASASQISLDDIAAWESQHGTIPQGAIVAIRHSVADHAAASALPPITADAAQFLMDARYTTGFAIETQPDFPPIAHWLARSRFMETTWSKARLGWRRCRQRVRSSSWLQKRTKALAELPFACSRW